MGKNHPVSKSIPSDTAKYTRRAEREEKFMKKRMLTILTLAAVLAVPLAAPRISSASEVTAATESMEGIAATESTEESGADTADEVLVGGGTLDAATGLVTPGLGSWLYETDDSAKVIYLTKYTGSYERIRVPAVYAVNGKNYAVKLKTNYDNISLPKGVFSCNDTIKEVQFEDGVGGDFVGLFVYCRALEKANIPPEVTDCGDMFYGCISLTEAPSLPSEVTDCGGMFLGCENLTKAPDLPSSATYCPAMFKECSKLSGSMDIMGKAAGYDCYMMFDGAATEGSGLTIYYADGVNIDDILATKSANSKITAKPLSEKPAPTPGNSTPSGTQVASYGNDTFYQGEDGNLRCYENGKLVTNEFKFDGSYTYYMQADGTPMKDRLTYHPDGEHIIYLDENGHEVFTNFQYCPSVGYICYFDAQGYLYKDQITFVGDKTYYLNGNGAMEQSGWFQFANGLDYGYANSDGTLVTTGFSYDPYGRVVFYHWNGMVARGLISDGAYYYSMDTNDGHYLGQFPVQ